MYSEAARTGVPLTNRRRATVAVVVAAVTAALIVRGDLHHFYDLKIYWNAIRWWADGNPLYDFAQPDRVQGRLFFTYPPLAAAVMFGFGYLPLGVFIGVLTAASLAALVVTTWWIMRPWVRARGWPAWYALGLALPPLLLLEPTRETIWFGQINLLLIALILGDLLIAAPRQARWTGVGIGLATALKLYPGVFILHLIVTRQWRAAATAAGTAAGATLLVAAVAPATSWRFWTGALWSTERIGRTDYTGNQSIWGLMSRLALPDAPDRALWLALVLLVGGYGMWRAARLERAGARVAALTVTGLVGSLISPIAWAHHVYWFVPALFVLVVAGFRRGRGWWVLAGVVYVAATYGVVSFVDWGSSLRADDPLAVVLLRSLYLPVMVGLIAALPTDGPDVPAENVATPAEAAQTVRK